MTLCSMDFTARAAIDLDPVCGREQNLVALSQFMSPYLLPKERAELPSMTVKSERGLNFGCTRQN